MQSIEYSLIEMHHECALRDNASSRIIGTMAQLGKPFNEAVAAGLLSMGGKHAPVMEAQQEFNRYRVLGKVAEDIDIIPGFGSAWFKGEPDPVIEKFFNTLPINCDEGAELVDDVAYYTKEVQLVTGKELYPNAALATAVGNLALKQPPFLAPYLVIQGRVSAWAEIYTKNYIDRGF